MPDDVGGQPFPDGEGPDSRERGAADEVFAAVVLDESFIEAARIHEPTAEERMLYATLERAEAAEAEENGGAEGRAAEPGTYYVDGAGAPGIFDDSYGPHDPYDDEGRFDSSDYTRYLPPGEPRPPGDGPDAGDRADRPRGRDGAPPVPPPRPSAHQGRPPTRWQRPVACVMAMVMGISVIALALIAVQRAGSASRPDPSDPPNPAADPDPAGPGAAGNGAAGDGRAGPAGGPPDAPERPGDGAPKDSD